MDLDSAVLRTAYRIKIAIPKFQKNNGAALHKISSKIGRDQPQENHPEIKPAHPVLYFRIMDKMESGVTTLQRDQRLMETEADELLGYVAPIPEAERVPGAEAEYDPPTRMHLADALMDVLPHPSEPGISRIESLERAVNLEECIIQVLTWSLARATQRDLYH